MAKEKLSNIAYDRIKKLIQNGEYSSGDALPEADLSAKLGISRTPIREALQRLSEDMAVVITPHLGATVASFDINAIRDLYETREVVEGMMVRRLCEDNVPSEPFQDMLDRYLEFLQIEDTNLRHQKINSLTDGYRIMLREYCPNKMLSKLHKSLMDKVSTLHKVSHVIPIYPDEGARERIEVLYAIISRDADHAEKVARYRVRCCLKRILEEALPKDFRTETLLYSQVNRQN